MNTKCKCGAVGEENFKMVVTLISEQPLKYYHSLPDKINLQDESSRMGTWALWDSPGFAVICKICNGTNYPNLKEESIYRQIKLRIKNYFTFRTRAGRK